MTEDFELRCPKGCVDQEIEFAELEWVAYELYQEDDGTITYGNHEHWDAPAVEKMLCCRGCGEMWDWPEGLEERVG